MQCATKVLFASVLILAYGERRCDGTPLQQTTSLNTKRKCPKFMENLYEKVLKGEHQLPYIVHSNEAVEVKRLNTLFEGTFNDLSFTQREILERARLRLNILKQTRCAQKFTLRLIDGETYQVIDEYILEAKHNGVNSIHLTSSLKKLVLAPSVNKSLRVKIVFNNSMSDKSLCNKTTSGIRKHVYLVTHTKEKNPRRYRLRRSPKNRNLPSSPKTCTMQNVYVNLRHLNNTVVAPPGFTTGLCGTWQPIPIGADPIIKRVAKAVYKATRSLPQVSNPKCCIPTAFNRLPILYLDSMSHSVLRYLDKVLVTKCGCPSKT